MNDMEWKYQVPEGLETTILGRIVAARLPEIAGAKTRLPAESLRKALSGRNPVRSLKTALQRRRGIIAEIKKASPSAGLLRADFNPAMMAREYEEGGAAAISVLTEANFFQGNLEILASLRWATELPLLRKDFIVDPYQVLEARHAGADAVLLIAALLPGPLLSLLRNCVEELGMDALVEVHAEAEMECALGAGATLIGVNSRDLRTFEISLETCERLGALMPKNVVAVAESGIHTADDLRRLARSGYRGFLIGGFLMRAKSPSTALRELTAALTN
jgi:indole-3-glycerol phosphate synthase